MITIKDGGEKTSGSSRFNKEGKNDDIFTPHSLAKQIWYIALEQFNYAYCNKKSIEDALILDPCCGKGALIDVIPKKLYGNVIAVDINSDYITEVRQKFKNIHLINTSFFNFDYRQERRIFDIILMNPPFSIIRGQPNIPFWDHALSMLSECGVIVSVAPSYYLVNSEKRKNLYANNILRAYILPKNLFDTKGDGKPAPFHTYLVVLVKHCENNTFLFLEE